MHPRHPLRNGKQQGAVLVVSLLLLLVMTVLALTASQSTRLQERMAGNLRDSDMSFQAGEAGLRAAEERLDDVIAPKLRRKGLDICPERDACDVGDKLDAPETLSHETPEWWDEHAFDFAEELHGVAEPPVFFSSLWADVPDTLTMGASVQRSGTMYYTNVSRSVGGSQNAVTVVESNFAVRY